MRVLLRFLKRCEWLFLCLGFVLGCAKGGAIPGPSGPVCELPSEGQRLGVDVRPTGLPSRFQYANQAGTPEITLFLQFSDDRPQVRYGVDPGAMYGRTQQCLAQIQPFLKGPGGESLVIRLAPEAEVGASPFKRIIQVTGKSVRGHSALWQAQWGCPEIMHEVFHLVGLVDEYADGMNYGCRAIGPQDSIMVSPHAAYQAVLGQRIRPSILYPAQFRAITAPGCQTENRTYYACAANAYRSAPTGCTPPPPECSGNRTDWVNL